MSTSDVPWAPWPVGRSPSGTPRDTRREPRDECCWETGTSSSSQLVLLQKTAAGSRTAAAGAGSTPGAWLPPVTLQGSYARGDEPFCGAKLPNPTRIAGLPWITKVSCSPEPPPTLQPFGHGETRRSCPSSAPGTLLRYGSGCDTWSQPRCLGRECQ